MPIIKSAIKKVKQDKKRNLQNRTVLEKLREAVKNTKKGSFDISAVFSIIDRAAKKGVIHKNKADRLKSVVSKRVKTTTETKTATEEKKAPVKKKKPTKKTS